MRIQKCNEKEKKKSAKTSAAVRSPPLVNDLHVSPLEEVAGARRPGQHQHHHVSDHLLLLPLGRRLEPFLQPQLPLPAKQQQEVHLRREEDG